MSENISFHRRVQKRLKRRINDAFGFMVATAWASLFDEVFVMIVGENPNIFLRIVQAVLFTILAVVATMLFDRDDDHDD